MSVSEEVLAHLTQRFPGEYASASITFVGVPEIQVLMFYSSSLLHCVTYGAWQIPYGSQDMIADTEPGMREFFVSLRVHPEVSEDELPFHGLHKTLAIIAASPLVEGIILSPGSLIEFDEPLWRHSAFTACVITDDNPDDDGVVSLLRVVPVTATEAAFVRVRGFGQLEQLWEQSGIDISDPLRAISPGPLS